MAPKFSFTLQALIRGELVALSTIKSPWRSLGVSAYAGFQRVDFVRNLLGIRSSEFSLPVRHRIAAMWIT